MAAKRRTMFHAFIAIVVLLALVLPWAALADDISNNLDASIDATLEVMNLTQGGATGSTILRVVTQNGDGKNGCNLTGSTTLVVSVNSSNGTVATVSPASVTFTSCGDTHELTVTPQNPGSATISLTQTRNTTDGTFNLAPASFTVNVAAAAPTDATPPSISYTLDPSSPDGDNGWYKNEVTLTWTVTENDSPSSLVKTGCVDQNITADQAATTYSCSATSDGGSAGPISVTIKRDATNPVITDLGPTSGPDGSSGWYISEVTNKFEASDETSGFASDTNPYDFTVSSGTAEGPDVTVNSGSVVDAAGNTNPGIASAAFKIDLTDPTVVCDAPTPTFTLNQSGALVFATVGDDGSGPASISASAAADTSSIGSNYATITGYDNAGRSTSVQCPYNVIYNWNGFFQPVDNLPTVNAAKAGSAIPLKFSLSGNQGLSIFAAGYPTSAAYMCSATAPTDAIEQIMTAGSSSLQYDASTDTYTYVWKTDKSWAGSCRVLVVKLADGTTHTANFNFTK